MLHAMYPGSFDPPTKGHVDMIKRSAQASDKLIVGVGQNPNKKYMFSFPERVKLICGAIEAEIDDRSHIEVSAFSGLLVDYAYKEGISHIIKGVRSAEDMDYELMLHNAGETQKLGIETFMLPASQDKTHVSSSVTKALLSEQGDIRDFVTLNVKQALESRLLGQYPVGVTGTIGAGKSYVTDQFVELGKQYNIPVHDIDLDKIGHYILCEGREPGYVKVRAELAKEFGVKIMGNDAFVDRKILGPIVFGDEKKRKKLDEIMSTPIGLQLREEMKGKKGIMLVNGALLAEAGISSVTNNNVVLVDVDRDVQNARLEARGHDSAEIERRVESQFGSEKKKSILGESIEMQGHGKTMYFKNNGDNNQEIKAQFFDMLEEVDLYGELRLEAFLQDIGLGDSFLEIYSELKLHYDSSERAYHNWSHIVYCMDQLYRQQNQLSKKDFMELFFAFLYHDIIYDAKQVNGENEEQSALFAEEKLKKFNISGLDIERVLELIRVTAQHNTDGKDEIMNLIIDIDMSILGAAWEDYLLYTKQIRKEYAIYSDNDFYTGRLKFLQSVRDKQVFYTDQFNEVFHEQAQQNIEMEIALIQEKLR